MRRLSILLILICWSCQTEENRLVIDNSQAISTENLLFNRLSRSVQNNLVFDDFIDQNSATQIELPFQVEVNNQTFDLSSTDDYQTLIDFLESSPEDDNINLQFPVEVSLIDYTQLSLSSTEELNNLTSTEIQSSEINCIEINYPIELNITDLDNSFITTEVINSDQKFINQLISINLRSQIFSIEYPISLEINGQEIAISSNTQLSDMYFGLDNSCYNPNLYEFQSGNFEDDFIAFITSGNFEISLLEEDGEPEDYPDYEYVFNADGSITVIGFPETEMATWEVTTSNNQLFFSLEFDDSEFNEIDEEWNVLSYSNASGIELQEIDDSDSEETILIFSKL